MKKLFPAALAAAVLSSTALTSAFAADIAVPREPVPAAVIAPVFSWTGFYVGGYLGGASRSARFTDIDGYNAPGSWNVSRGSFLGGLTLGYNWQFTPNVLVGLEGEVGYLGGARRADPLSPGLDTVGRINDSAYGLITARLGFTADRALFYVKGGLALGGGNLRVIDDCDVAPCGGGLLAGSRGNNVGWTIGGGIEYALTQNWTMKGEYNYVRFGGGTITALDNAAAPWRYTVSNNDAHLFKVGVNYLFSTGGGGFAARY